MLRNKYHIYGDELVQVPAHLQYGKYLFERIKAQKDKIAIINGESGESLTYKELTQKVVDISLSLTRVGMKKGDVVGICSEKNLDFIPTVLAIACAGATICLVDVNCERANILHRLNVPNLKLMFCSGFGYNIHKETFSTIPGLRHFVVYGDQPIQGTTLFKDFLKEQADIDDFLPVPVKTEDTVIILYTSGTTGLPKGIPWTNRGFLMWMQTIVNPSIYKDKVALCTREWCYSYGLSFTLCCMAAGASVVYCPRNGTAQLLSAIQSCKTHIIQLAPSTLIDLVTSPIIEQFDISSVEMILSSAISCSAELIKTANAKFLNLQNVYQVYGMAEVGGLASDQNAPKGSKYGSAGIVGPGQVIKVVDLVTRVPLGPNQRGELCVKSVAFTPSYLNRTSSSHLDEEGFFITGDVAYYDEDGYVFFVDRMEELINFNSYQVVPAELEAIIEQHPAVRDAGVVGAPHPEFGEAPTAFVVLQPRSTISVEELTEFVDERVPQGVRLAGGIKLMKQLPRIYGDKLNRKALKLQL